MNMAGGAWDKGNNPYFNYDFDAAAMDSERIASNEISERALRDREAERQSNDAKMSNLRVQMNSTISSHKKVVNEYEEKLDEMKMSLYKLALRSNILHKTLMELQEKWPDKKEEILDEIQKQKDYCLSDEYRNKWWEWVNDFKDNPDSNIKYFSFPFEKRELKNK
jgi:chromosome segregation ATPase